MARKKAKGTKSGARKTGSKPTSKRKSGTKKAPPKASTSRAKPSAPVAGLAPMDLLRSWSPSRYTTR